MKKLLVSTALLSVLSASAAYAAPMCNGPDFSERDSKGRIVNSEQRETVVAEQMLHSMGIDAHNTRFWNGCIQAFVTDANGHDQMHFYDPNTYAEIPAN